MKLGTETASLTNHILSGTRGAPQPEIGMGCTILMWTDRTPGTIVGLRTFKTGKNAGKVSAVLVQEDNASRIDTNGMSESQSYTFTPNPEAPVLIFKAGRNAGGVFRGDVGRLRIGERGKYHDFGF